MPRQNVRHETVAAIKDWGQACKLPYLTLIDKTKHYPVYSNHFVVLWKV